MVAIEENTNVDDLGKGYIPEGARLSADRGKQAKTVYDDPKKWLKHGVNRSDLKGFDTRRAPQKANRRINYESGDGYIEQEADRWLRPDQESFKLLNGVKNEIMDYDSFKKALHQAWDGDNSLRELISDKYVYEGDFKALFNHPTVQKWLNENIENTAIPLIMKLKNVEENKARSVFRGLSAKSRGKLLSRVLSGKKIKIRRRTKYDIIDGKVQMIKPGQQVKMITQVSRGGVSYKRSHPVRWTEMERNFVMNNQGHGLKYVTDIYFRIFSDSKRTKKSISNKFYRINK